MTSSSYNPPSTGGGGPIGGIPVLAADPVPAGSVPIWFNTTTGTLSRWDGTQAVAFDQNDGEVTGTFGTPTGIDI